MGALVATVEAAEQVYDFHVSLEGRQIGTHRFTIREEADGTVGVQSHAGFDVRVLGFTAYRYRHQASESWSGGCLSAINASTNDNGHKVRVVGYRREGRFRIEQPAVTSLPDCLVAYAYWDRDLLLRQSAILNPQTGKLDAVRVEPLGKEFLELRGQPVAAERFRLHAALHVIDLWYSQHGEWLRLESTIGRRRLVYRLE